MNEENERTLSRSRDATKTLQRVQNILYNDLDRIIRTEQVLKRDKIIFDKVEKRQQKYRESNLESKKLIASIDQSQRRTKILSDIGFFIFLLTLIYLLSKRIPPFVYEGIYMMFQYVATEEKEDL